MPLSVAACAGASVLVSCAWGCMRMTEQTIWAGIHPACSFSATAACLSVSVNAAGGTEEEEFPSTGTQGDAADVMSQGREHGYEMRTVRGREPVTCGLL